MTNSPEKAIPLTAYKVYIIGRSDPIKIDAVDYKIDAANDRVEFFVAEGEKHPEWEIFLHGVAAIQAKQSGQSGHWRPAGRILN